MKATELQIGDWVRYTNPPYIQIASITRKKIGYHKHPNEHHMNYVRLCEVEPIPLTSEILEKNGFRKDGKWYFLHSTGTKNIFSIGIDTSNDNYDMYLNFWAGSMDFSIKYVHQLQQIIRLCGINKEIIL